LSSFEPWLGLLQVLLPAVLVVAGYVLLWVLRPAVPTWVRVLIWVLPIVAAEALMRVSNGMGDVMARDALSSNLFMAGWVLRPVAIVCATVDVIVFVCRYDYSKFSRGRAGS
jgi:hypothetical protein